MNITFRQFKASIKNCIRWFPVIWKDRDWDHCYFYDVLDTKLKHMINNFEKSQFYVGVEKDIKKMQLCRYLLKRLIKDDYDMNAQKHIFNISTQQEYEHGCYMEEQDRQMLFNILGKNITKWWW